MEVLNIAFHLVSFLLALLAAFLLLWINYERKHSNRLLAFVLILFAMQNLVFVLLFSKLMLEVPWLLRVFGPSTFLIGPLTFVYIRSILNNELKFKKYDWLLLIPAILALINFIPYYLLPTDEKIAYLNNNFYNKTQSQDSGKGILPSTIYYVIRVCWSGILIFLGFRLLYLFKKRNTTELLAKNNILLKWLFTFNCLLAAILIVTILKIFIPTIKNTKLTVADILLAASILFICLQLFIRPQILYGIFQPLPKDHIISTISPLTDVLKDQAYPPPLVLAVNKAISSEEITALTDNDQAEQFRYKNLVETYFREKRPFLQSNYSLEQLVIDTHIPRYILSAFINREYGMGFREFLNRYRVEYLIAHLNKPEWQQFTLEAIATECGFSSRITFFKNFKQITGQTPSKYIREKHKKELPESP
jgi:AraC-like DNA-binding protein